MRMKNEEAWESQSSNDESLVTKNVFINGKMEERVIALPKNYLMEQPKDKGSYWEAWIKRSCWVLPIIKGFC